MNIFNLFKTALFLFLLLVAVHSAAYSYSACPASRFNPANLACNTCPANQLANNYQTVAISCQCAPGFLPGSSGTCSALTYGPCLTTSNNFQPVYRREGDISGATACSACASTAFVNKNGTGCTPCGPGMTYTAQGCTCSGGLVKSSIGCFTAALNPSVSPSYVYFSQLAHLIPGCGSFGDYLSCSQLVNLCAYSQGLSSAPQCQFFTTYSKTNYLYAQSSNFALTFNKNAAVNMKLVQFLPTGNYIGERTLLLGDLMRCGTPANGDVSFLMGSNFKVKCSYDFNNFVTLLRSSQTKTRVYQVLLQDSAGKYHDLPVYMPLSATPIKRFFLQDTYTYSDKINVLTSFTLSFTLNDAGALANPRFQPTYRLLSVETGTGIVPSGSSLLSLTFNVFYISSLSSFWIGGIISFSLITVIAIIHAIVKTYIDYLNRRSVLRFMLNLCNCYSLWLFYYLLCLSGYWFLFTKTTSAAYLLLPPNEPALYAVFYALVGLMFVLRAIWAIVDKSQKMSTQVFMINWEPSQFRNSWRQIFIVNSLAQFYSYRTISLFWMLIVVLFFTNGVGWETLAAQTATVSPATIYLTLSPINRLLLYFLACSIFLAVGVIFKILRRVSVIVWPYPFEDFVDYCTVCNISFFFMRPHLPQAYYLHAALPERAEVTFKEINEAIRRGLIKNRAIANQLGYEDKDSLRLYSLYVQKDLTDRHDQLLASLQQQVEEERTKFTTKKTKPKKVNLREQFIEGRLKPHLETVPNPENDRRQKSFVQSFMGTPPVDLRGEGVLKARSHVFRDSNLQLVSEVFPNGNQFQEIHTFIVIFVALVTLINSCPIAAFLTFLLDALMNWWIETTCRSNLQQMTRVKRGFMI